MMLLSLFFIAGEAGFDCVTGFFPKCKLSRESVIIFFDCVNPFAPSWARFIVEPAIDDAADLIDGVNRAAALATCRATVSSLLLYSSSFFFTCLATMRRPIRMATTMISDDHE